MKQPSETVKPMYPSPPTRGRFACWLVVFSVVLGPVAVLVNLTANSSVDAAPPDQKTQARLEKYEQFALVSKGDAGRGKQIFEGERAKCSLCHRVGKRGGQVGPDLSSIGGKFDRPHLIESLLEPSQQIVEGYRTSKFVTTDGRVITGVIRHEDDNVVAIGDSQGKILAVLKNDIERRSTDDLSIMPSDLVDALTPQQVADLVTYLESLRGGTPNKPGSAIAGPIGLPEGFAIETLLTGLTGATAMEALPDGRILLCDQTGSVNVVREGNLLPEPLITLPVDSSWERGVIGVTIDPQFPAKPYVYVCWVAKAPFPHHRVSRFEIDGDVALADTELVLLTGDDQRTLGGKVPNGHQGGGMHFGDDQCLYIGIGEQTAGAPSQKLDSLLGKILRLHRDGTVPNDNPFLADTLGKYQTIWARGLRNPFTFAFGPDGTMLINDVGGKFEEINVGVKGANYGWPSANHGPDPPKPFVGPIHWYPEASISGGDFVPTDSNWPTSMKGRYLFADFKHGWIHSIDPSHGERSDEFAAGLRRPVDLRFGPDGQLYVLLRNAWVIDGKFQEGTGSLLRISYVGTSEE